MRYIQIIILCAITATSIYGQHCDCEKQVIALETFDFAYPEIGQTIANFISKEKEKDYYSSEIYFTCAVHTDSLHTIMELSSSYVHTTGKGESSDDVGIAIIDGKPVFLAGSDWQDLLISLHQETDVIVYCSTSKTPIGNVYRACEIETESMHVSYIQVKR